MKNLKFNSPEFVKSNIYYSQDHLTAHINSIDICEGLNDASDKDEAFNEAVEYVTEYLQNYGFVNGEYNEDGGNCSMTWIK